MPAPLLVLHDHADGDPLASVRGGANGGRRFLLVGSGDGAAPCADAARRVLAGYEPVFGLAGLVLIGADAAPGWPADLPVLRLPAPDDDALGAFWDRWASRGPVIPSDVVALLASDRVSRRTREAHALRALADDPDYAPRVLSREHLAVLRAVADVVVPQPGPDVEHLDLAARVDAQLADGVGDGWRPADNPPDVEAYTAGLTALADLPGLSPERQEQRLHETHDGPDTAWFEDCRTDLVRHWLAHPASMVRIGYDGFANGGDEPAGQGFVVLDAGARETWEPSSLLVEVTR